MRRRPPTACAARARLEAAIALDRIELRDPRPPAGQHAQFGAAAAWRAMYARKSAANGQASLRLDRSLHPLIPMRPLLLAARRCATCLLSSTPILPPKLVQARIGWCREQDRHHTCHLSPHGANLHCRGVHDRLGGSAQYRFALAMGYPVVQLDPYTPHSKTTTTGA